MVAALVTPNAGMTELAMTAVLRRMFFTEK
jgi:hypothetical protein